MQKIDKSKILSIEYKDWENEFEQQGQNHPKYNSSKNEHYLDVVMNLLHVQNCLCAYTEMRLCKEDLINEQKWEDGKYKNDNPEVFGQLDHFDPNLKANKAWLWNNFFIVDTDINTKVKGKKEVDNIMKPDTEEYDPSSLLEYDSDNHIFIPHSDLSQDVQVRVKEMIIKLGLNFDPVADVRRRYIANFTKQIEFGIEDWDTVEIDRFPTTFNMCRLQNQ